MRWKPVKLTSNGPSVSHLLFADDVLLFAKGQASQAKLIMNILNDFSSLSGLKVSLEKSRIFASSGLSRQREINSKVTRMNFTFQLGKYPGFKFFHGRSRRRDYMDIMGVINSKLAAWKGRLLNKPGRMVMENVVMSFIPSWYAGGLVS